MRINETGYLIVVPVLLLCITKYQVYLDFTKWFIRTNPLKHILKTVGNSWEFKLLLYYKDIFPFSFLHLMLRMEVYNVRSEFNMAMFKFS